MRAVGDTITIAAVQASPVFLDRQATIEKACALAREAAGRGARLVVFPEAFVSAYPLWVWFVPAGQTRVLRELYAQLHASAVEVPGPALEPLQQVAAEREVTIAIGVNERNAEGSGSTLFNTLVYIGPDGSLAGKHRKLVPTGGERLVWGRGDGSDLEVLDLAVGRVGGLICWENYMPLARYALAAWGEQIHVAPTWDRGEPWLSSMRHIAKESRAVVIGCCQAFHKDDIPERFAFKREYLAKVDGWINPGDSVIVDPDGKLLAGPAREEETILTAEVPREALIGPRWQLDIAGHYARPDVFELRVHRRPSPFVRRVDDDRDVPPDVVGG